MVLGSLRPVLTSLRGQAPAWHIALPAGFEPNWDAWCHLRFCSDHESWTQLLCATPGLPAYSAHCTERANLFSQLIQVPNGHHHSGQVQGKDQSTLLTDCRVFVNGSSAAPCSLLRASKMCPWPRKPQTSAHSRCWHRKKLLKI